ncbi:uncharacterized protein [Littorina saxatilis]|uniref:uncharacterized protein n=1 Tax=Littorina saxatilis TaxID=31220 RepID=UPI0038B5AECC
MDSNLKRRDPMQPQQPQHQQSPQPDSDGENNASTASGDNLVSPCKRLRLRDGPEKPATFTDQTNNPGISLLDQTNQGVSLVETTKLDYDRAKHDADLTQDPEVSTYHGTTFLDRTNTKAVYFGGNKPGTPRARSLSDTPVKYRNGVNFQTPDKTGSSSSACTTPEKSRFPSNDFFLSPQKPSGASSRTLTPEKSACSTVSNTPVKSNHENNESASICPVLNTAEKRGYPTNTVNQEELLQHDNLTNHPQEFEEQTDFGGHSCDRGETAWDDDPDFPPDEEDFLLDEGEQERDVQSHVSATPQRRIPNNTPEKSLALDDDEVGEIIINRIEESEHQVLLECSDDSSISADEDNAYEADFDETDDLGGLENPELQNLLCDPQQSVTFADQTNTQSAHRRNAAAINSADAGGGKHFEHFFPQQPNNPALKDHAEAPQRQYPVNHGPKHPQSDDFSHPNNEGFNRKNRRPIQDFSHPNSEGFNHNPGHFNHHQIEDFKPAQRDVRHHETDGFDTLPQRPVKRSESVDFNRLRGDGFAHPHQPSRRPQPAKVTASHQNDNHLHVQRQNPSNANDPQNLQRRVRVNSAGNLLCPEELDHHRLSLQSYGGSLAQFATLGPRRRVGSQGSFLDAHEPPFNDMPPGYPAHHRRHLTTSASQENVLQPQNLAQRFSRAPDIDGRVFDYGSVDNLSRIHHMGSSDGPGGLVNYGSVDILQGGMRGFGQGGLVDYGSVNGPSVSSAQQGGLVNYGNVDGPLGGNGHLPRPSSQGIPVDNRIPSTQSNGQQQLQNSEQPKLWFYGSVDNPQRLTGVQQTGQQFQGSQHQAFERTGSLMRQKSDQAFVRSAARRTLPRLGSQGSNSEGSLGYFATQGNPVSRGTQDFAEGVRQSAGGRGTSGQNVQTSGHSGHQGNAPAASKASTGTLCTLPNSGSSNQGNAVHGYPPQEHPGILTHHDHHHGMHVQFQHAGSGSHAQLIPQGSRGQLVHSGGQAGHGQHFHGSFDHYDIPEDHHQLVHSGSQGSIDSHGRSVGSQKSSDSHGRSVKSHRSADSQGRSSQRSQQSVESLGRSERSQRSVDSHGRSTGSQQSAEGRGRSRESKGVDVEECQKRKVLETPGQLSVAVYLNCGLVTVHVIEGRSFSCTWKQVCDSYIKLSLIPEEGGRKLRLKSKPVVNTNNPLFDEKFSLELQKSDENKRLLVSVWHKDLESGCSEFLGCMSFGVKGIIRHKDVNGWYYLLTEDVGKKKHLEVNSRPRGPTVKAKAHSIPQINKDVLGLDTVTMKLERGKNGFGFTVVDEFPVKVGRVDLASPAEEAGLKPGDYIIKVNNQNVSRSTVSSVAKLVKKSSDILLLLIHRPQPEVEEPQNPTQPRVSSQPTTEPTFWKRPDPIYESIPEEMIHEGTVIAGNENKENEISVNTHFDMSSVYEPFTQGKLPASTPLPSRIGKQEVPTSLAEGMDQRKSEAIHRLMSLELDFIDFMQLGVKRYCRPLKHCIFNVVQHNAVFQNVEKLVNISEYHVQQMQENAPSMYPESDDDSQSSEDRHFASAVAMIYNSKAHMFCQAHESYAEGLSEANRVLSDMRQNEEFLRFIKDPPLAPGQPSISAFIFRPLQHIKELCAVLQEIFACTPKTSAEYSTLKQVTHVLQDSVLNISNMSNARVQSLTSLTSHTKSSSSGKGSCAASSIASSRDSESESSRPRRKKDGLKPSVSLQTMRTVDREVMKMQDRLVFSENVPVFQLCQEDRHIIYQAEVFYMHNKNWSKIQMVLFSDILLLCRPDKDGSLHVLCEPVLLHDICQLEYNKRQSTELVVRTCPTSPCTGIPTSQRLVFRTPTPEDLSTWKNLLGQRIRNAQGNSAMDNASCGDAPPPSFMQ